MEKIPEIKSSKILYEGYISLREDKLLTKDGKTLPFNVVEPPSDAVAILAQTTDNLFVMCSEYRHGVGRWVYSLPGGNLDGEEDALEAGKRELLEETGFECKNIEELAVYYPCPAILDQRVHLTFATEVSRSSFPMLEPGEWIETHLMSEAQIYDLVANGAHVDGLLLAMLHYHRLQAD